MFITNVEGAKPRQLNDKETAEQSTPQVNNAKFTKTELTLHKKIYLKIH